MALRRRGGGDSAPQRDEACVPQPIQQLLRAAPAGRRVESLDPVHPVLGLDGASLIDVPVQMPQLCVHARTPGSDRRKEPPSGWSDGRVRTPPPPPPGYSGTPAAAAHEISGAHT
jgi:hypothetical protein